MPALHFDTVTAANVYLEDNSLYGRAQEVSGLSLNMVMKDINPIGMYAKKRVPVGVDNLELTITWDFINEECVNPFRLHNLTIYGNVVRTEDGTERELQAVIELRGRIIENNLTGTLKGQDWSGQQTKFALDYILVKHDDKEIIKVDVDNNIFEVNGEDQLSNARVNGVL